MKFAPRINLKLVGRIDGHENTRKTAKFKTRLLVSISATGRQKSLRTRDEAEALQLINARALADRFAHGHGFNQCVSTEGSQLRVDMNWLPATVIPRRQWPAIQIGLY